MPPALPDPLGFLRDAWAGAEDAARSLAGQERVRLAVTGLSRAGKTVFLSSLIANLIAAGAGLRTLPALETASGGRLRRARVVPAGVESVPRFDPQAHLAALAADPPRWPERTEDLSTLAPEITAMPLAQVAAGAALPLDSGLNPAWAAPVKDFASIVVVPLLGAKSSLTES